MIKLNFNRRVWAALKLIPRGRITTYKEIAVFLGRPKAARAVGNACHKNSDAPATPCHRVIATGGKIGGYAGGAKRKVELLKKENVEITRGKVKNFSQIFYRFARK